MTDAKELDAATTRSLNGLYRGHAAWLARALRQRLGAEDAGDLVHDTYLQIRPYLRDEIRHPKALLWRIALNLLRDRKRREAVRLTHAKGVSEIGSVAAPQFDTLLLKELIKSMPEAARDVFVLARFEGMTQPQIAQALGISLATVERRMAMALQHCSAALND
ncbi:RNA polymerase sigma factor [Brevundimonas nasdae]|uniref:Sigma-70 family RNA polymerase sigma factor n=1 Tax=Brevundimonas nasdae TaxID=172043 RepID=A0ABX8TPU3_9CAUL|nr:sigma-70 family RNA polymerase sigma factor [Brevundimonas nasdae]QYC11444.1 sigma-70 family RNA polymerase sigma factor [Brevundimonas nasdae]QYC14232.1 sigma-70 family RNA polymerase sigma factor [Brevundimonas nasdae]